MAATQWIGAYGTGGGSTQSLTSLPGLPRTAILLVAVGFATTGQAVTAMTIAAPGGATGTFAQVGTTSGGGRQLELWIGYNFSGYPTQVTVAWSGGGQAAIQAQALFVDSSCASMPTVATATNTGTSTAADSGTLTPGVGNVIAAVGVWASGSGSSARTSFGNTFAWNQERNQSTTEVALVFGTATAAAASHHQWTIGSAAWIGLIAALTMPAAAAAVNAFVYKGRDSAALDAGTVA